MKKYSKSAIILLAALSLAGCSKTEEFEHNPDNALQIESVSGISPFALMQGPASKAVISGETLPGDEAAKGIGLFVTASDGSAYDGKTSGYSNVKYAYGNEKWSAASPIYLSNTTGKLYGYFPYNADATDLTAIPVESSLNGTDYLYATSQDVSFSNKSVNLEMNHALARLHLTIKKGDKYLSDCNLTKISIKSTAIDANGTMDITTGIVTSSKAADATGTFELTGSDAVTSSGIEKDILLVPANTGEGKKDLTLTLTIDGVDASVNFTGDKCLDIRSGIQCNATIEIQDTGIKVSGVGVGVWGEGGGQTVEISGHTVTVKLTEVSGIEKDILVAAYVEGTSAIIKAQAESGRPVECVLPDDKLCDYTKNNNIYTFTISDITSDLTATVGYTVAHSVSLNKETLELIEDYGQYRLVATVLPEEAEDKALTWSSSDESIATVDQDGYVKALAKGTATITVETKVGGHTATCTVSVQTIPAGVLPGVFSVSATKQVFFSKGNLWYGKLEGESAATFHFESNQYESTPLSNADRDNNHISHFMWCSSVERAIALRYSDSWDSEEEATFFAASDFTVNGFSVWSTLTKDEWAHLLNTRQQSNKFAKDTNLVHESPEIRVAIAGRREKDNSICFHFRPCFIRNIIVLREVFICDIYFGHSRSPFRRITGW